VPGGFSKPLTEAERKGLLPLAQEVLELAKFAMAWAKQNVFPKYLETVKTLGVIRTGFLGTVDANGALNCYDGTLRLMKPDGSFVDFPYDRYTEQIGEKVLDWWYLVPFAKAGAKAFHGPRRPGHPTGRTPGARQRH
jgi:F420-non-reducing hydrogenase large subunit